MTQHYLPVHKKESEKFFKDLVQESARYNMYQCTEVQDNGGQQTRQYLSATGP